MPQVSCLLISIAHAKRRRAALWRQTCPNGLRVSQSLSLGTTSQLLRSKTTCTHAHAGMPWFATLATIARGTSKVPAGKRVCNLARALRTLFLPIHRHSRERTALEWKRDPIRARTHALLSELDPTIRARTLRMADENIPSRKKSFS
jgi:hypothetical protein